MTKSKQRLRDRFTRFRRFPGWANWKEFFKNRRQMNKETYYD